MTRLSLAIAMLYFAMTPILQARLLRLGPISVVASVGVLALMALFFELLVRTRPRPLGTRFWWASLTVLCGAFIVGLIRGPSYATTNVAWAIAAFLVPVGMISFIIGHYSRMVKIVVSLVTGLAIAAVIQTFNEFAFGTAFTTEAFPSVSRALHIVQDWQTGAELGIQSVFGCIAMAICAVACTAYSVEVRKPIYRWFAASLALVLLIGQSRGGYAVSNIIAAMGMVCALIWGGVKTKRLGAIIVLLLFVLMAVLGAMQLGYLDFYNLKARLDRVTESDVLADPSIMARWEAVKLSFSAFLSSPLTGIGMQGWFMDRDSAIGGHSSFVDVLGELGIIGFIGYYGLLVGGIRKAIIVYRSLDRRDPRRPVACGVVFAGVSFFLASLLDPVFLQPILSELSLCFVGLGITLGLDLQKSANRVAPAKIRRRRHKTYLSLSVADVRSEPGGKCRFSSA